MFFSKFLHKSTSSFIKTSSNFSKFFPQSFYICKWNVTITAPSDQDVFDRSLKLGHKNHYASLSNSSDYDYFRLQIANRLVQRMMDLGRDNPTALALGASSGELYKEIISFHKTWGKFPAGIEELYCVDFCEKLLFRDDLDPEYRDKLPTFRVVCEETNLPFDDNKFDMVISNLSLQWINDVPLALREVLRVLKPDGVFIGSMAGGSTLQELRSALLLAEQERRGGMGTHISPMIEVRDMGNLLGREGFELITIDNEIITIPYPNMFILMEHIKGMGDNHAAYNREKYTSRDTFLAAASIYDTMYNIEDNITHKPLPEKETQITEKDKAEIEEGRSKIEITEKLIEEENKKFDNPSELPEETEKEDKDKSYYELHGYKEEEKLLLDPTNLVVDASFQIVYFVGWSPDPNSDSIKNQTMTPGAQNPQLKDLEGLMPGIKVVQGDEGTSISQGVYTGTLTGPKPEKSEEDDVSSMKRPPMPLPQRRRKRREETEENEENENDEK